MKVLSTKVLPYQVLLDKLILVNHKDEYLQPVDKWTAHSNKYLAQMSSLPHRAFSIFLFNNQNQLLLQKRSIQKKTFPLCWTNTCCSHPNMVRYENGQIGQEPIRQSLHRALHRELRMDLRHSPFYFMNKILYKQLGPKGNDDFGEFEVDYVYLNKISGKNIDFEMVPQEVADTKWVAKQQLGVFMEGVIREGGYFSPWFDKMVASGLLYQWWGLVENNRAKNTQQESSCVIDFFN